MELLLINSYFDLEKKIEPKNKLNPPTAIKLIAKRGRMVKPAENKPRKRFKESEDNNLFNHILPFYQGNI